MEFEIKQNLKTTQRLSLSTELKNSITILSLGRTELENFISDELEKNPCLIGLKKTTKTQKITTGNSVQILNKEIADNSAKSSLHHNLFQQISMLRLSIYEQHCVKTILQYIDDNGYLNTSLEELATQHEIHFDDLKFALETIQKCDPPGLGARNLQECLILQLDHLQEIPKYVHVILKNYWEDFEKLNFSKIAKIEKASLEEIKDAFRFIRDNLDPKPARQFGEETNQIVIPDVYIFKRDGEWICSLNQNGLPRIKLSTRYQSLMTELKNSSQQKETVKYLNENTRSAKWLIRSLEERNKTILKVTEIILQHQMEFFENGVEHLVPLTLRDVAQELDLHESTISRSTSGKYLFCNRGVFELKYFFNSKMETSSGKEFANESIKQWVQEYIKNEDKENPLSDQDIATKISTEKHVVIARRTISKYREALKILPSSKRSKKF
ncbi:MAG: RNA polymerase factor sigma-54 [Bdellovibrionota bacterium]